VNRWWRRGSRPPGSRQSACSPSLSSGTYATGAASSGSPERTHREGGEGGMTRELLKYESCIFRAAATSVICQLSVKVQAGDDVVGDIGQHLCTVMRAL
jgi:hypothetical protein